MALTYLGMCSISLPLHGPDGRPTVGLMASLPHGEDDRLPAIANRIAKYLRNQTV
jgi:aspartyl-tRNA(Asn)/glutamyl-tRNA(Gln) amidotransferase subunit A